MRWTQPLYLFLLVASAVACASRKVGNNYDLSTNFSTYHTYAWVPGEQEVTGDKRIDNSLVDNRIRTTIGTQLRSKGYAVPAGGSPDLYLAYYVVVKDMIADLSQHFTDEYTPPQ